MQDVVIVSACRSAIGAFGGSLRDTHAAHIAAAVMKTAVQRAGIDPGRIDDVRFGCCLEPSDALNVARVASLLAGIPDTVTAATVNRVCISGMEAVVSGMAMIQAGMADIVLAGGVEHMSGVPYEVPTARWGCRFQDQVFVDALFRALHSGSHILPLPETAPMETSRPPISDFVGKPYIMGHTAEFMAQHFDISRQEMDELALRSNHNAERATADGDFEEEIVPLEVVHKNKPATTISRDEHFRPGLTMEDLAGLFYESLRRKIMLLPDDVLVQRQLELKRRGQSFQRQPIEAALGVVLFGDKDRVAQRDAFIADVDTGRAGDQAVYLPA